MCSFSERICKIYVDMNQFGSRWRSEGHHKTGQVLDDHKTPRTTYLCDEDFLRLSVFFDTAPRVLIYQIDDWTRRLVSSEGVSTQLSKGVLKDPRGVKLEINRVIQTRLFSRHPQPSHVNSRNFYSKTLDLLIVLITFPLVWLLVLALNL